MEKLLVLVGVVVFILVFIPIIARMFLRDVNAGTIRIVSWMQGAPNIYRGPGKSKEIPLLTTGTTISAKAINVDLDITDQTADVDPLGVPRPIKVRVLASAIVSVGDSNVMITTAANRFFSKGDSDQLSTLTDLLSSSGRRAINLLTHDQLFSAKTAPKPVLVAGAEEDDDPLAVIIRKACSKELTDLGLGFNSLNIKVVQSEVAEARRTQSAAEAKASAEIAVAQQNQRATEAKAEADANAAIKVADQARRAKEAQLDAERAISDSQRALAETNARNAALVATAESARQDALAIQRKAELGATQLAQATADAERVKIAAEAAAEAEAVKIRLTTKAQAEGITLITEAIKKGGSEYLRLKQLEMLPQIAPAIADALARSRMITLGSGTDSAAGMTMGSIGETVRTFMAFDLARDMTIAQKADEADSTKV